MTTSALIGEHPTMVRLRVQIARAAELPFVLVIHGETGVGKELVAAAVHRAAGTSRSFVPVNVAALPEQLAEAELFGVAPGAYTGAERPRAGLIEEAANGTLFLDEAADLPRSIQAKLLRALDSGEVRRVGANGRRRVRFRLLLSVQCPVEELLATGRWRADFFHRAAGIVLDVPPLRDRLSDLPLLVNHFLREYGRAPVEACDLDDLLRLRWPGNVRQLRRAVERTVFDAAGAVDPARLNAIARAMHATEPTNGVAAAEPTAGARSEAEAQHIRRVLTSVDGDTGAAACVLGISRSQLYRRMRALAIATPRRSSGPQTAPLPTAAYLRICE